MGDFNKYFLMKENDIIEYVKEKLDYFDGNSDILCEEIGDGNLNFVFRVKDGKKSVIVKQAGVNTRNKNSKRTLSLGRNGKEADVLLYYFSLFPDFVPKVYHVDYDMHLFIMEDLYDYISLRDALMNGKVLPLLADQISSFIVESSLSTSAFFRDPTVKKNEVKRYINPDLCKITEELVFTEPFFNILKANRFSKSLNSFVEEEFYKDKNMHLETAKLKYDFMNNSEALIHGDLHTGSIFVNDKFIKVMDVEFAFYGPIGYDLGNIIANIIFAYIYRINLYKEDKDYISFLENTIIDIISLFKSKFLEKFKNDVKDPLAKSRHFIDVYLQRVIETGAGICGLELIRRTTGCAKVKEIESVEDDKTKENIEISLLKIGKLCVLKRKEIFEDESFIYRISKVIEG